MKAKVFVIMPFQEDFLDLYEELKNTFQERFDFSYAGDMDNQQNILKDIVEGIYRADVIIVDLTDNNPNVFYEMGLAHAMNKKVIIITQDVDDLPFDIKSYRAHQYSLKFNKIKSLICELDKCLNGAIDGEMSFGNPVSDYLPNQNLFNDDSQNKQVQIRDQNDSILETDDAGLLDYMDSIQQSSEQLLCEINTMGEEISFMSDRINDATSEINRVKTQSGNLELSFIRKTFRKLGEPICETAGNIGQHVDSISNEWSVIENSFLMMLDNKHIKSEENKEGMKKSLDKLKELQETIAGSKEEMDGFVFDMNQVLGYERTLTRGINALSSVLERYAQTIGIISSSIDRIISKGKIVLG